MNPDDHTFINRQNGPNDPGFNPDDYKQDFGVETLSEEEIEMLKALWHIMSIMVDIGWGVESVQLLLPDLFGKASVAGSSLPENPVCANADSVSCENDRKIGGEDE